jgi:hypothetical protein
VGLWRVPDPDDPFNFVLGVMLPRPDGVELLGWWIIPLGLALGLALGYLTWRFGVTCVRLMARAGRRRPAADPVRTEPAV